MRKYYALGRNDNNKNKPVRVLFVSGGAGTMQAWAESNVGDVRYGRGEGGMMQ